MRILKASADPTSPAIQEAAKILRRGGLVAFPTETVYGLGASALDAAAVQRIFDAKGRPSNNPLIIHVHDSTQARELASEWPELAEQLATRYWPGPLTLVLPKRPHVPAIVTANLQTVALRVPAHPVARALLAASGLPIAAPSANRSMELSPTRAEHVAKSLGGRVDLILDGGATDVGIESTVVDLSVQPPAILRPGTITARELRSFLPGVTSESAERPAVLRAPGMMDRHYAPRAELVTFHDRDVAYAIEQARNDGRQVGVLSYSGLNVSADEHIQLPGDAAGFAQQLYAALHALDDAGCSIIFLEEPPQEGEWAGVLDRVKRMKA
jgi:L-threonylcarbamoyladenylate synthase